MNRDDEATLQEASQQAHKTTEKRAGQQDQSMLVVNWQKYELEDLTPEK